MYLTHTVVDKAAICREFPRPGDRLWTDHRIGGHPQTVHGDSRDLMQLPERVKKLVCFVCTSDDPHKGIL